MTCPFCAHKQDRVIDSRESKEGDVIRRRRQCLGCERRFTTYERSDEIPYMVVKKDGRREKFDRQKVLNGLLKACEKRPVPMSKLAEIVDAVEAKLADSSGPGDDYYGNRRNAHGTVSETSTRSRMSALLRSIATSRTSKLSSMN